MKKTIWGLFYLGVEIDRFDGNGEGVSWSKEKAIREFIKEFILAKSLQVKEIK